MYVLHVLICGDNGISCDPLVMIMITLFEHYSFNVETIYNIRVSYDTPTIPNKKNFAYVESSKSYMLVDHEKNALCAGYIV